MKTQEELFKGWKDLIFRLANIPNIIQNDFERDPEHKVTLDEINEWESEVDHFVLTVFGLKEETVKLLAEHVKQDRNFN